MPVGPEDGCMHVVPASHDELFASEDPRHLRVMSPSPPSHGTALSCQAGEVAARINGGYMWIQWIHDKGKTV